MPDLSPPPRDAIPPVFAARAGAPPPAPPLTQVIRQQVVPALIDLHGAAGPMAEADELAEELARGGGGDALLARLIAAGAPFEALMLRMLAPAARRLGEMWEEDRCSFAAVTLALWRLRQLAGRVAELLPAPVLPPDPARSILVAAMPGEQHDFGVAIVAEFLARDGWMVTRCVPRDTEDLLAELAALRPAVIGIAIARSSAEAELASLLLLIRRRLRAAPPIMLGGAAVARDPALAARCGADAAAICARTALEAAERLLCFAANNPVPVRKDRCVGSPGTGGGVPGPGPGRHGPSRLDRC